MRDELERIAYELNELLETQSEGLTNAPRLNEIARHRDELLDLARGIPRDEPAHSA